MPRAFVVGNWKMNTTPAEAADLASGVRRGFDAAGGVEVVLCPPFVSLAAVREAVGDSGIRVGAQNMYFETSGAFTGEVSPAMLSGLCDYVILGHSERRQLFGETDESVNRKVHSAIAAELRPILCVGETLEQREQGQAADIIAAQVRAGLRDLVDISSVLVAYEPVWAIGTGLAATPEIANEIMGGAIQETLRSLVGDAGGSSSPVVRRQRQSGQRGQLRQSVLRSRSLGRRGEPASRTIPGSGPGYGYGEWIA